MTEFIGKHYLSTRGQAELDTLRIGKAPNPTGGQAPIQMLGRVPSEECGCPEEIWSFDGMILLFHFDEDGSCDAFIFAGDWDAETSIAARSMDDLRAKSFQWLADILDGQAPTGTPLKDLP